MQNDDAGMRSALNELAQRLGSEQVPVARAAWGGAGVVVADRLPESASDGFYPEKRIVITAHAMHLSWLFERLWAIFRNAIGAGGLREEFFGRLANGANDHETRRGASKDPRPLLCAVLREANAMVEEFEEGTFECLGAALGNTIADDVYEAGAMPSRLADEVEDEDDEADAT